MSAPELKPCPFCGRDEQYHVLAHNGCYVTCSECGCRTVTQTNRQSAQVAWNRRATPPQTNLDRAWAWFRQSKATIREYPHGAYWAVMQDGKQIGTGPTKAAAVLAAWRAATGEGRE